MQLNLNVKVKKIKLLKEVSKDYLLSKLPKKKNNCKPCRMIKEHIHKNCYDCSWDDRDKIRNKLIDEMYVNIRRIL